MKRSTAHPVELGIGVGVERGEQFSLELHGDALQYHRSSWMSEATASRAAALRSSAQISPEHPLSPHAADVFLPAAPVL